MNYTREDLEAVVIFAQRDPTAAPVEVVEHYLAARGAPRDGVPSACGACDRCAHGAFGAPICVDLAEERRPCRITNLWRAVLPNCPKKRTGGTP